MGYDITVIGAAIIDIPASPVNEAVFFSVKEKGKILAVDMIKAKNGETIQEENGSRNRKTLKYERKAEKRREVVWYLLIKTNALAAVCV